MDSLVKKQGYIKGLARLLPQYKNNDLIIFDSLTKGEKQYYTTKVQFISGLQKGEIHDIRVGSNFVDLVTKFIDDNNEVISSPLSRYSVFIDQQLSSFQMKGNETGVFVDNSIVIKLDTVSYFIDGNVIELNEDEINEVKSWMNDRTRKVDSTIVTKVEIINNFLSTQKIK